MGLRARLRARRPSPRSACSTTAGGGSPRAGTEHVPPTGPALLVANHAGVVPWDGAMVATAVRRATGRQPRALVLDWAFSLPWVASVVRRTGGVPASPANARALLEAGHAVVVFPEGAKGLGKPWRSRYRLERFGRGGFVEVALRTGAPIVPCAVVGSEEIHPKLAELPVVARLLARALRPGHADLPAARPAGAVPLPSRWRIAFGAPVDLERARAGGRRRRGPGARAGRGGARAGPGEGVRRAGPTRRSVPLMAVTFRSPDEFHEVMDRVFGMMDDDPEMGPKLRDADVPQRFEFTDVDMVVNVRAARAGEGGNLHWEWSDDVDWDPRVRMAMSSETANKYFQGKENVAIAIARRRIRTGGDVKAALSLIPITKPVYARYRGMLEDEFPHLVV